MAQGRDWDDREGQCADWGAKSGWEFEAAAVAQVAGSQDPTPQPSPTAALTGGPPRSPHNTYQPTGSRCTRSGNRPVLDPSNSRHHTLRVRWCRECDAGNFDVGGHTFDIRSARR